MSFSVFNQVANNNDDIYKLVQLPKELLEYLKTEDNVLEFKSPVSSKNQLVLCTDSDTYLVRQMNHSNTQLVVEDLSEPGTKKELRYIFGDDQFESPNNLLAVGLCSYLYELTPFSGEIETEDLPIYDGSSALLVTLTPRTTEEVLGDSPIAGNQFYQKWHELGGCNINNQAVILDPAFITEALYAFVSIIIAEKLSAFSIGQISLLISDENPKYTMSVVQTLAGKFCDLEGTQYTLNSARIAKWFGIMTLKKMATSCTDKDVLLNWKSSLPPFFNALLDLRALHGHYFRPIIGNVQYLNPDGLSMEIHARIKEMFEMCKEWDFDEFLAFIKQFIPSTKKPDAVILKYAKKKRNGKLFIICPR